MKKLLRTGMEILHRKDGKLRYRPFAIYKTFLFGLYPLKQYIKYYGKSNSFCLNYAGASKWDRWDFETQSEALNILFKCINAENKIISDNYNRKIIKSRTIFYERYNTKNSR